jgi:hypothetical protein
MTEKDRETDRERDRAFDFPAMGPQMIAPTVPKSFCSPISPFWSWMIAMAAPSTRLMEADFKTSRTSRTKR